MKLLKTLKDNKLKLKLTTMKKAILNIENNLFDMDQMKLIISKEITFKHAASGHTHKRKGYEFKFVAIDGLTTDFEIIIEPVNYTNGDKWIIYGTFVQYFKNINSFYSKNLTQVYNTLKNR